MTAQEIFDHITNTAREVRPAFAAAVSAAFDEGDAAGDGFEPDIVTALDRAGGRLYPDLDLYVHRGRLLAVADKGGDWAVDITERLAAALG